MKIKDRLPALASRDFLIFWVGQFISLIGTWMQNTTQPYLAYRITGSSFDLGIIAFSSTVPTLILALPGGVLIERWDKRKIVIIMQVIMMAQAFLLALLALAGFIRIWHIIILSCVLGAASAIEITARQAMLIELVGKPALPNAIALQSTIFNLARVIGPSFTAIILILAKTHGEGWAFFANGISFLFVIVGLFFVKTPYKVRRENLKNQQPNMMKELQEGWSYIRGKTVVLLIVILVMLVGFFGFPFSQQIPAIARNSLSRITDAEDLVAARTGILYSSQGVGALIAALYISAFSKTKRKNLLMGIGQLVFSISLPLFALTRNLSLAVVLIFILGWATVTQLMLMNIQIQLDVPDELRGRVFSIYLWAQQGIAPFGSLFLGGMAQATNVSTAIVVCGIICLLAVLFIHAKWPILWMNEG